MNYSQKYHELKTWPDAFQAVVSGIKTAEFRREDRNETFDTGDLLNLREWCPDLDQLTQGYTGQNQWVEVTHVVRGPEFGIPHGYVMLSIRRTVRE